MANSNFISVLQFQLMLNILCTSKEDILKVDNDYFRQMDKCIEVLESAKPDICIFPEMSFRGEYNEHFTDISKRGTLIVFGSTYVGSINKTKIYQNGVVYEVIKRYPCGSEPMVRFFQKLPTEKFLQEYLSEHEFYVKGLKVYILNCLEYYQSAYMIARDDKLSKDLFAFIVPCSNSNPNVFIDESKAIHNHNENIYSFVCNRVKCGSESGYGKSYVYGPIQGHEKDWLKEEGIQSDNHVASILTLDDSTPSYAFGKYLAVQNISRFGRSDFYINTPAEVKVGTIF